MQSRVSLQERDRGNFDTQRRDGNGETEAEVVVMEP